MQTGAPSKLIISNIAAYRLIADEAYREMAEELEARRRPKPDGTPGWVVTYDPSQSSFKKALISIIFTAVWLDALTHLLIVRKLGRGAAKKHRNKSYEDKLELLGIADVDLLHCVSRFRKTRNEIVHEKAHFDSGEVKTAQKEAQIAYHIRQAIEREFANELEGTT